MEKKDNQSGDRVGRAPKGADLSQNRAYGSVHGSSCKLQPYFEGLPMGALLVGDRYEPTLPKPVIGPRFLGGGCVRPRPYAAFAKDFSRNLISHSLRFELS